MKVVFPLSWCRVLEADGAKLRAVFGDAEFERHFDVRHRILLDPELLSPQLARDWAEVLLNGSPDAARLESRVVMREVFNRDRVLNERASCLASDAEALGVFD